MNLGDYAQIGGFGEQAAAAEFLRRPRPVQSHDDSTSRRPRVVLYMDDTGGLGQLRRNLMIGRALAQSPLRANTIAISSSMEAGRFPSTPGVDWMTLPFLRAAGDDEQSQASMAGARAMLAGVRSQAIAAVIESFEPDLFIVDTMPTGADHELIAALERTRSMPSTTCVLGLPDVLGAAESMRAEWDRHAYEAAIGRYYDQVWVYGDPAVFDLGAEYELSAETESKLEYTGYFDSLRNEHERRECTADVLPFVDGGYQVSLCMAGSERSGVELALAFAAATLPEESVGMILLGAQMDAESRAAIKNAARANRCLGVIDFVDDPRPLIERADYVIAAGGYNTVSDLMAHEKPTLLVPDVSNSSEHLVRAQRLSDLDLVDVALPQRVTPEYISRWLVDAPRPCRARTEMAFTAAGRLVELVEAARVRRAAQLGVLAERRCA